MSIIYMAQTPQGFGHSPSQHNPNFYVNSNGDATDVDRTDANGNKLDVNGTQLNDPRTIIDYSGSTGDKIHNASSWARRYYASNVVSANHANDSETELIIGAKIDLSVSAGCTSVSGSVSPSLTDNGGISTSWIWRGKASLTLRIEKNENAHSVLRHGRFPWIYYCHEVVAEKSNVKTGLKNIGIKIVPGSESDTESNEFGLELSEGPAKVNAKWSRSKTKVISDIYSKITGISASLNSTAYYNYFYLSYQQVKTAKATGHLGESAIDPDDISTWYNPEHECNGGFGSGSPVH